MRIEPLRGHERTGFASGAPALDRYFRSQAGRDAAKKLAAVFVLVLDDGRIGGFYCLAPATVLLPGLVGGARTDSRYPELKAALLPRLGVDRREQGRGLGRALLADARTRLRAQAPDAVALIAAAPDDTARGFYTRAGFAAFPDQPQRLFQALAAA
jgi:GNAT superfamily N-acetyltransferase